jgi:hypothetical protein
MKEWHMTIFRGAVHLVLSVAISGTFALADDEPPMRVTHVLGLEGVKGNANGNLSIQEGSLQFRKSDGPAAQISIPSIVNVFLGEQDKQVGGTPMTVGKVAAPFGGGRVVSLFSHKKYDTLTIEYLDANGGLHGAIFQLNTGQGQVIKNELVAGGAHVAQLEGQAGKPGALEVKNENK